MSRYIKVSNEDGTFTNEKCYTAQDMEAFHKWLNDNGWYLIERIWHNDSTDEELTLDEVIITWEESE